MPEKVKTTVISRSRSGSRLSPASRQDGTSIREEEGDKKTEKMEYEAGKWGNISELAEASLIPFNRRRRRVSTLTVCENRRRDWLRFGWDSPSKVIGTIYNGLVIYGKR